VDAAKRTLRIQPLPGFEQAFDGCETLYLRCGDDAPVQARTTTVRRAGKLIYVGLTPGFSRDATAGMRHAEVLMPVSVAARMYTVRDLVDMRVETASGELLGVVFETIENSAGGAVRLKRPDGSTAALALPGELMRQVDYESGVIRIGDPTPFMVLNDTSDD
jgi:ribosomal 30S subunit maturation factor RimM